MCTWAGVAEHTALTTLWPSTTSCEGDPSPRQFSACARDICWATTISRAPLLPPAEGNHRSTQEPSKITRKCHSTRCDRVLPQGGDRMLHEGEQELLHGQGNNVTRRISARWEGKPGKFNPGRGHTQKHLPLYSQQIGCSMLQGKQKLLFYYHLFLLGSVLNPEPVAWLQKSTRTETMLWCCVQRTQRNGDRSNSWKSHKAQDFITRSLQKPLFPLSSVTDFTASLPDTVAPPKAVGASGPHSGAAEPQQTLNLPQTLLSGSAAESDHAEENRFVYLHCMCLLHVFQKNVNMGLIKKVKSRKDFSY